MMVAVLLFGAMMTSFSFAGDRFWLTRQEIETRYEKLRRLEINDILEKHRRGEPLTENESAQAIRYLIQKGLEEIEERRRKLESEDSPFRYLDHGSN